MEDLESYFGFIKQNVLPVNTVSETVCCLFCTSYGNIV